jgi:hypothetical protein
MSKGLPWLPLLFLITWLAWSGWNEFQKVQTYSQWAAGFDKSKYDLYAVLGLKGTEITWGTPARRSPIALQTFSLTQVTAIALTLDAQEITPDQLTDAEHKGNLKGKAALAFQFQDGRSVVIPFTEVDLAMQWGEYLRSQLENLT